MPRTMKEEYDDKELEDDMVATFKSDTFWESMRPPNTA